MQELITKGFIVTEELSAKTLESGTIALVKMGERYYRVTLIHLNKKGNWVVDGDYTGEVSSMKSFFKFVALCEKTSLPVSHKDYKYIINKQIVGDNKLYTFNVKPHRFKEGKYERECVECHAQFIASSTQPYCKKCCRTLAYANIIRE